jgi:hypothetical protein
MGGVPFKDIKVEEVENVGSLGALFRRGALK